MKDIIISRYKGEDHKKYKSLWKHAYRATAKKLELDVGRISQQDEWESIQEILPSPYKPQSKSSSPSFKSGPYSSTSSLDYQKKLTSMDYAKLGEIHSKINYKWILSSGNNVEDIIYNASKTFNYQQ